jgi:hypothetical protein
MPVFVWDEKLAMEWLNRPTQKLHRQLDEAAMSTGPDMLAWHAVTTDMSSTKFRKSESMAPMKPMKTVKSFFGVAKKKDPPKSDPKIELRSKTTASKEGRNRLILLAEVIDKISSTKHCLYFQSIQVINTFIECFIARL